MNRTVVVPELMVTLAVATLIVTFGAPTMMRMLARHAIAAQADELQDAVRIGRNEAMKRGGPVVLCRTDAGNTSHCAGSAGDWQTWLLFADVARTGKFAGGDPILRQRLDVSGRMTVVGNAAGIRFESTGIAHADAGSVVFVLSPAGASAGSAGSDRGAQRQVCVNPRGAVVVIPGNETCP
jgi:type IV fimbrial biogenesis protein FimT